MQTGRLQRFEKTAGQTDGDTIALPHFFAFAGTKTDQAGIGQGGPQTMPHAAPDPCLFKPAGI